MGRTNAWQIRKLRATDRVRMSGGELVFGEKSVHSAWGSVILGVNGTWVGMSGRPRGQAWKSQFQKHPRVPPLPPPACLHGHLVPWHLPADQPAWSATCLPRLPRAAQPPTPAACARSGAVRTGFPRGVDAAHAFAPNEMDLQSRCAAEGRGTGLNLGVGNIFILFPPDRGKEEADGSRSARAAGAPRDPGCA